LDRSYIIRIPQLWAEKQKSKARAAYDPRSGVTLWQKMSAANKGAPPQWLSTHPSGASRIKEIENNLPKVMPLYEKSAQARQ
jgi:predicted Zn-dependent protease